MKISQIAEKYHNPDPLVILIGLANEAIIIVEGQEFPALIDSGAQLLTMSEALVQALKLPVHNLHTLIEAEVSVGNTIPYVGYIEARLQIPGIQAMNKDSLFMVSNNSLYMNRFPIQLGTLHIREAMKSATQDELAKLSIAWKTASFLSYLKRNIILKEPEFDLDKIKGHVRLNKSVTIAPFQTVQNYSCCKVMVPAKSIIAKVSAANVVPRSLPPSLDNEAMLKQFEQCQEQLQTQENVSQSVDPKVLELTPEREKLLFSRIDLTGAQSWDPALIEEARQLFREFAHIFALESTDMEHTSMVKHQIRLDNYTPFKERYRRIPPHLFDEIKNHLKEMIEVGAIHKSSSPWASAIVLVRKKDGSLRFCIDLCKLNAQTMKDAYSLPHIDETLDCLGGATMFTSLDLRSVIGKWKWRKSQNHKLHSQWALWGSTNVKECLLA